MFEQQVNLGPGTGTFTEHTFEILTMLLGAGLLGLWLGWMLWNRYKQEADKLRLDNQSLTVSLNALNAELNAQKAKYTASETSNISLRAEVDKLSDENRTFRDQLAGTHQDLAQTEQRNRQLETELGLSFTPNTPTPESVPLEITEPTENPAESPAQEPPQPTPPTIVAETPETADTPAPEKTDLPPITVAEAPTQPSEEKPEEEPAVTPPAVETTTHQPPQSPPQPDVPTAAAVSDAKDDLTVVEGIGPKIQELLYQYGIRTYDQLADTDVARLKEILAAAGPQLAMHDPGTWPSQANLAANDQWEALKSIQGFLKGGKKPT